MSKQSLVYLRPAADETAHSGCGVVVAGGLVATCRHVWEEASAAGPVVARFPHPARKEHRGRAFAVSLFDDCTAGDEPAPDLVLLAFAGRAPEDVVQAAMAHEARHQGGDCHCRALLPTRGADDEINGRVGEGENEEGLRSFVATEQLAYWFEPGSSGAPVFRGGAMVGLLRERDSGGKGQPTGLRMSFVVPASVILPHLMRATKAVADQHIPVSEFQDLLIALGEEVLSARDIPRRMMEIVAAQKKAAQEPVANSNLGDDVTETIRDARAALSEHGAGAALAKLDSGIAEIRDRAAHARLAEMALLKERARTEKLALRWQDAKATYAELARLDPDDGGWAHIEIGDMEERYGRIGAALDAYREALRRAPPGGRRESVAQERIGDMLARRGDGVGALAAYRQCLALAERLAADDPGDALAQRDLSVSHSKVGDMLARGGDGAGALAAYRRSLAIDERLAADNPGDALARRDLSVSHTKIGDMLAREGDGAGALAAYRQSLALAERLAADYPEDAQARRDLSVSHNKIGDMLARTGDGAGALAAYRKSLAIDERLAADDPGDAQAQRDLIVSCVKLSEAAPAEAVEWLTRALAIAEALQAGGRLAPEDDWMPGDLRERLAGARGEGA